MLTKIQSDLENISTFDPHMWELLRNKKIFATGCTGFIGTWIMHSFTHINRKYNLGAELHCLTRNKNKIEKSFPEIHFVEGDIQTFNFPEGNFDFVIHGATEVSAYQQGTNSSALIDVAYLGTKRLLQFSQKSSVKKILFLSSGAAYGVPALNLPFSEETYSQKATYGEAKRLSEMLLFNNDIPATSARIFAICGPFLPMDSQYALSNFLESVILDKKITIKSNGKTTRSYLYAGDVTLWLWLLLLKGKDKEIYNVGSEEEISLLDLAKKVRSVLGKETEIEILGNETGFSRYVPSNKKIRNEFNLDNLVPLDMGIKKTYDFLKDSYAVQSS